MTFRVRILASVFVGALALTGCSQASSTQSSSQQESSPASSNSADASTSASQNSAATVEIPKGYQEITAPTAKISVAVPEDWVNFTDLSDEEIEAVATEMGVTVEQYKQSLAQLDIFYRAPAPDAQNFTTNLNISRQTVGALPTEEEAAQMMQQQRSVQDSYEAVETANGEGAVVAYTMSAGSISVKGNMLFLPNADGQITIITVSASTAGTAKEIADVVVQTAH